MNSQSPPIVVTTGEPAGIGPQISILAALSWQAMYPQKPVILIGDLFHLREVAERFKIHANLLPSTALVSLDDMSIAEKSSTLIVWHCPLFAPAHLGKLDSANAPYVLNILDIALLGLKNGIFSAMVTAPVHKGIINDAGISFTGHTEYIAEFFSVNQVVMMLADGRDIEHPLRVALASTHLPLSEVSSAITLSGLTRTIDILAHDLTHQFGIVQPRILVSGLNPHAGEHGHMGREEIDIIHPAIVAAQARGLHVSGTYPADTLFQPHYLNQADAILAMYHDQGLPVLKYISFGHGVNITLGLPFIRTSVDHGTALDIACTGQVDVGSMQAAMHTAARMVQAQTAYKEKS